MGDAADDLFDIGFRECYWCGKTGWEEHDEDCPFVTGIDPEEPNEEELDE